MAGFRDNYCQSWFGLCVATARFSFCWLLFLSEAILCGEVPLGDVSCWWEWPSVKVTFVEDGFCEGEGVLYRATVGVTAYRCRL